MEGQYTCILIIAVSAGVNEHSFMHHLPFFFFLIAELKSTKCYFGLFYCCQPTYLCSAQQNFLEEETLGPSCSFCTIVDLLSDHKLFNSLDS